VSGWSIERRREVGLRPLKEEKDRGGIMLNNFLLNFLTNFMSKKTQQAAGRKRKCDRNLNTVYEKISRRKYQIYTSKNF